MIISKEKLEDKRMRSIMLECAVSALRMYAQTGDKRFMDIAKDIGRSSRKLKEIINKSDYEQRDKDRELADRLILQRSEYKNIDFFNSL